MSFTAEIEHIWCPPDKLPTTLRAMFRDGACTVWVDQQFTAAIPASNDDTERLADLFDVGSIEIENKNTMKAYYDLRDELCGDMGYQRLSLLFKQEMDKEQAKDEANERASVLACAVKVNRQAKGIPYTTDDVSELFETKQPPRVRRAKRGYVYVNEDGIGRPLTFWEGWLYRLGLKEVF